MPDGCQPAGELWSWKLCLRPFGVILKFSQRSRPDVAQFLIAHFVAGGGIPSPLAAPPPSPCQTKVNVSSRGAVNSPRTTTPTFCHSRHFTAAYEICAPMKWARILGKSATLWKMELPTKQHSCKTEGCNLWRCLYASCWLEPAVFV